MFRIVMSTLAALLSLGLSATAPATPPCKGAPKSVPPRLGFEITVGPETEMLCGGFDSQREFRLREVRVSPEPTSVADARPGTVYLAGSALIEAPFEDNVKRGLSGTDLYETESSAPFEAKSAAIPGCLAFRALEPGRTYLLNESGRWNDPVHMLRPTEQPVAPPPPVSLASVAGGEPNEYLCGGAYGYFETDLPAPPPASTENDAPWSYHMRVIDPRGDVVDERLVWERPTVFARQTEDPDVFRSRGGATFRAGTRYRMEVRSVNLVGERSAPTTASFQFEETGVSRPGLGWLLTGAVFLGIPALLLLLFVTLLFLGVRALLRG